MGWWSQEGRDRNMSESTSQELEETLKRLQNHKGVNGVIVINGEGAVVKTSMDNTATARITSTIGGLITQARSVVRDLDPANDLAFLRLRSDKNEILVAPDNDYLLVVIQNPPE